MSLCFQPNYNFELLSFLNILTSDPFYVALNREAYDAFYPRLSEKSRGQLESLVSAMGRTNITVAFVMSACAVPGYAENSLYDTFGKTDLILEKMSASPYIPKEYLPLIAPMLTTGAELLRAIEALGFRAYWEENRLPQLALRCRDAQQFFDGTDFRAVYELYKPFPEEPVDIYVCTFHRPHGTKLQFQSNNIIISDNISNETALGLVAHEFYHAPYRESEAASTLKRLAQMPAVQTAYDGQNANCRYEGMNLFLEENFVEALGIYVAYRLGMEKEPYLYFEKHDYGSHVLSPLFFTYLLEHPKPKGQSMEAYLSDFTDSIT